jgi:hypothetical protein
MGSGLFPLIKGPRRFILVINFTTYFGCLPPVVLLTQKAGVRAALSKYTAYKEKHSTSKHVLQEITSTGQSKIDASANK